MATTLRLTCCVCGAALAVTEAYQVGYVLDGWPASPPVSLYACKNSQCKTQGVAVVEAKRQAYRATKATTGGKPASREAT